MPKRPPPTRKRRRPPARPKASPPAEAPDPLSVGVGDSPLGDGPTNPGLTVTVVNGNLKFVRQPLLLGHYRSVALTGTEWVMDKLIGGAMSRLVWLGQYPDPPTSNKIFLNQVNRDNPFQMPRPEAVIVVGLGEEGNLKTTDLTATVSHGVIAWAQRLVETTSGAPSRFELSATLIGSGGAGISAGQSALAVVQGVREANQRLRDAKWPIVEHLYLIELYLDRATEAWRALHVLRESPDDYRVAEIVKPGTGGLRRPYDSGYRGADYDFVSAISQRDIRGDPEIAYRLDTKRARTELHASSLQAPLLRELVVSGSNDSNTDTQIGHTLFQLLIPREMEPFMAGATAMVLELDAGSAGLPWELLDTGSGTRNGADDRPWAIRAKLLRKLRTDDYRARVVDADAEAHVLVIGEPQCDPERYPALPGAQEEARSVVQRFVGAESHGSARAFPRDKVKALIPEGGAGADARTVINAVLERPWRIVHIAGHGEPPEKIGQPPANANDPPQVDGDPRGVVLSNGTFLGPREIKTMRVVPELVFVNCCHLAARNVGQLLQTQDATRYNRATFAAGVAESLIKIGVRCVIAAGWAVEDDPAKAFATALYDRLLDGSRFIDAVTDARIAARAFGGNTWAAYQCYGDPDWKFRWGTTDAQAPATRRTPNVAAEFESIASADTLDLALETIATRSKYDKLDPNDQRLRLEYLEQRFAATWGETGWIAEEFARAWAEVGDHDTAIAWYQRALGATDASASMSAAEQLGNHQARASFQQVEAAQQRVEKLDRECAGATKQALATLKRKLAGEIEQARADLQQATQVLEELGKQRPTTERLSLCGSAWKRAALIERVGGDSAAEDRAVAQMRRWYERADQEASERNDYEVFYPGLNRMAAELILNAGKKTWRGFDADLLARVRTRLETEVRNAPDFWCVVGRTELRIYEALAAGRLADEIEEIEHEYDDLQARVSAARYWDSAKVQLQLLLPKYAARASKAEAQAALALLAHVTQLVENANQVESQS